MATARAIETDDSAAEGTPPKPKRPPGRPRTRGITSQPADEPENVEASATQSQSSAELDKNKALDFFDLVQAYNPSDWSTGGLIAYLYRTAPVIDRGRTGQQYNLTKYTRAFDVDEIMKAPYGGSGGYKVMLRRFNADTRHTDFVRDHFFQILNFEYPPRIPAGDWLDNENNREWQWAKPKLEAIARAEASANAPAAGSANGEIVDLLKQVLPGARKDEAGRIADEVVQAIQREQPKTAAGLESIVLRLLDRDNEGGAVAALRVELAEARRRADDLMFRMLDRVTAPATATAAPTLAQQLKELIDVKESVGALFGRGGARPGDSKLDWQQVGMHVADKLFEAAPGIMQAFAMGKAGIKQPTRRTPTALPGGEPVGAASVVVESPEEVSEMIAKISSQFGPMFDEVTPFLSNYFARGVSGMHFRDWLIEEYGRRAYDVLRQMHPQTIVDVIELRKTEAPENLRGQLALLTPRERLLEFIEQFLSDEEATYEDVDQPDAAAPPPVPNGALRQGRF